MKLKIKKNQDIVRVKVAIVAVIALFVFLLISNILRFMSDFITMDTTAVGVMVRVIVIIVAVGAIFATWFQDKYEQYILDDDKLIIERGFLNARQQIIALGPSTVSNIDLSQPFFGGMFHYGTIRIDINNFGGKETYQLKNIDQPQKVFSAIDKHMQDLRKQG
ncbi:PH domain-containing protein [Candidatus Saccharibacteria bacterium]|nr:PH domain-containing protein [Candidatus Saccharibacteria bacterium]